MTQQPEPTVVDLSVGPIAYEDSGGDGTPVVLLHGLAQNGSVWRHVVEELGASFRCIVPHLPYGSQHTPLNPGAQVTPHSVALLIGEFADTLKLGDDTVFVENDAGRLQQLAAERPDRVGRMVIAGCEAFDNYPPGSPGKMLTVLSRVPGGIPFLIRTLSVRPLRRMPGTGYAVMSRRPVPHELIDDWIAPLRENPAPRALFLHYLRSGVKTEMLEAADALRAYDHPALVVWGKQDRMMPLAHAHRLAQLLPQGRLVELDDCGTLIPLDQPRALATAIRDFTTSTQ
ncbi:MULTISPECIES: alpha/beta fold hydrolase [unclassified Streptomyces]|uniref:alpha/beta fold hydrolase n=1 Tax=unclassified Streptomyces TaxID=2593676 RepID=UPI00278C4474|nr:MULTISPECIES: alpha/beta hydrolase [unclassified Streptomyces]